MPKYSAAGMAILEKVHPDLRLIFMTVIEWYDITILPSTVRTLEEQAQFVKEGKSLTMNSLHLPRTFPEFENKEFICAVDATPYPVNFNNTAEHYFMAGLIIGIAEALYKMGKITHRVRWGGRFKNLADYVHFELILE